MASNFTTTKIGDLTVYYSYTVPIAFRREYGGYPVVRQNEWSTTTGAHLSKVDGGGKEAKARRLPGDEWEAAFKKALAAYATA